MTAFLASMSYVLRREDLATPTHQRLRPTQNDRLRRWEDMRWTSKDDT